MLPRYIYRIALPFRKRAFYATLAGHSLQARKAICSMFKLPQGVLYTDKKTFHPPLNFSFRPSLNPLKGSMKYILSLGLITV